MLEGIVAGVKEKVKESVETMRAYVRPNVYNGKLEQLPIESVVGYSGLEGKSTTGEFKTITGEQEKFNPSSRYVMQHKEPKTNLRLERGGRKGSRYFRNK